METLKERMEGFAGRVSATSVKLTVAVPWLLFPPLKGPLQEDNARAARKRAEGRVLRRFIRHPTASWCAFFCPESENAGTTPPECNAAAKNQAFQKQAECSSAKRRGYCPNLDKGPQGIRTTPGREAGERSFGHWRRAGGGKGNVCYRIGFRVALRRTRVISAKKKRQFERDSAEGER